MTPLANLVSRVAGSAESTPPLGATVLVTPREPTSTGVVGLLLDAATGLPAFVVKLPRLGETSGALAREAAILREIQARRGTDSVPAVVALTAIDGTAMLVETALVGATITPRELRRHPRRCVGDVLRWLLELPEPRPGPPRWDELVDEPLRRLEASLPPGAPERDLVARTLPAVDALRDANVPTVVEHGDLSHPNLLRLRDGRVGVVDWELAEANGLPLVDLCFFLGYVATKLRRAQSPRQFARAFDDAFAPRDGWGRPPLLAYARRVGLERSLVAPLVAVTWARYAARIVTRVEGAVADPVGVAGSDAASALALEALRESPHRFLWERAVETWPHFDRRRSSREDPA